MKLDLARTDKLYYDAPGEPVLRTFPAHRYVTATGSGAPLGERYSEAVAAVYQAAYGAKKIAKAAGTDFVVPKLEGLWWVDSDQPPLSVPREQWHWTMMIRMPDSVRADMISGAVFEELSEGECVQVMHRGPYADEPETLTRMAAFMDAEGLLMNGRHHEIYLTDPRRTQDCGMRTILRHPVRHA